MRKVIGNWVKHGEDITKDIKDTWGLAKPEKLEKEEIAA